MPNQHPVSQSRFLHWVFWLQKEENGRQRELACSRVIGRVACLTVFRSLQYAVRVVPFEKTAIEVESVFKDLDSKRDTKRPRNLYYDLYWSVYVSVHPQWLLIPIINQVI